MQKALYNFIAPQLSLLWLPVIIFAKSRSDVGSKVCANRTSDWGRWTCVYRHTSLYFKLYINFFHFHFLRFPFRFSPPPAQPSLLFLNIYIILSFLNKSTISGFLYVKTMTKWFYSQFWKWLNLTTIVFYDNLSFHVPGLLLYQHFFFFFFFTQNVNNFISLHWLKTDPFTRKTF